MKQWTDDMLEAINNCENCGCEACDAEVEYQVGSFIKQAGFVHPETLASEYVRLDKVVEGRTIPENCAKGDFKYICHRGRCRKCPDHIESRPATVSDLIGGKG